MLDKNEIKEIKSSWNSPPMMVPQPDKIQLLMTIHGEKAMERF
jgi:hypothetical protein